LAKIFLRKITIFKNKFFLQMMITHHFGYRMKFLRKPWDSIVVVVVAAYVVMEKTLEKTLRSCEAC
jgi:hypothetical protein